MFKKIIKYRVFVLLGLVFLISIFLSTQKYISSKKKASEIVSLGRWTVDQIEGKVIKGEVLNEKMKEEQGLREDIQIIKDLDTFDKTKPIKVTKDFGTRYKSRFGIEIDKTYQIESDANTLTPDVQVKGASSVNAKPTVGSRSLPTTSGFNVDTFTGTSSISYPINTPPALGNLPISVNLSYSSRAIDELRLNKPGLQEKNSPVVKFLIF